MLFRKIILPILVDIIGGIGLQRLYGINFAWFLPVPFLLDFLPLGWLLNIVIFIGGVVFLLKDFGII